MSGTTMSLEEFQRTYIQPGHSKYGNRKASSPDGHTFDSRAERDRYEALLIMQVAGEITSLACQPTFVLQEGFRDKSGKWQRAITYRADFSYFTASNHYIVEDVKGHQTDVFKLKLKLFLKRYPGVEFRTVAV